MRRGSHIIYSPIENTVRRLKKGYVGLGVLCYEIEVIVYDRKVEMAESLEHFDWSNLCTFSENLVEYQKFSVCTSTAVRPYVLQTYHRN